MEVYPAIAKIRQAVPTARRVVVAHWENFRRDAEALRAGQATGKYDAFLLMPRGVRDEEFHTAIIDLLNDWAATVAVPEVVSVRIVTPEHDVLTLQLRDYLERVGLPCGVFHPDSDEGRDVLSRHAGEPDAWPVVEAFTSTVPFVPTTHPRPRGDALRPSRRHRGRPGRRPRGHRRRTGRARGQRVRRQRGAVHGHRRGRGDRRPGRHQLDDPQLPRLPARHLRACGWPSAPATRRSASAPASSPAGRSSRSSPARDGEPARRTHRGRRRARPRRGDLHRRHLPADRHRVPRRPGRVRRPLRRRDDRLAGDGGRRRRRGRRRQQRRPGGRAPGPLRPLGHDHGPSPGPRRRPCRTTWSTRSASTRASRCSAAPASSTAAGTGGWSGSTSRTSRAATTHRREIRGLFLLLGADPHCEWLPDEVARDERGFVLTGRDVPTEAWRDGLPPANLATTVPGIFAAGDIRSGSMKRVASASRRGRVGGVARARLAGLTTAAEQRIQPNG